MPVAFGVSSLSAVFHLGLSIVALLLSTIPNPAFVANPRDAMAGRAFDIAPGSPSPVEPGERLPLIVFSDAPPNATGPIALSPPWPDAALRPEQTYRRPTSAIVLPIRASTPLPPDRSLYVIPGIVQKSQIDQPISRLSTPDVDLTPLTGSLTSIRQVRFSQPSLMFSAPGESSGSPGFGVITPVRLTAPHPMAQPKGNVDTLPQVTRRIARPRAAPRPFPASKSNPVPEDLLIGLVRPRAAPWSMLENGREGCAVINRKAKGGLTRTSCSYGQDHW